MSDPFYNLDAIKEAFDKTFWDARELWFNNSPDGGDFDTCWKEFLAHLKEVVNA